MKTALWHRRCSTRSALAHRRVDGLIIVDYSLRPARPGGEHEIVLNLADRSGAEWSCQHCRQPVILGPDLARRVGRVRKLAL